MPRSFWIHLLATTAVVGSAALAQAEASPLVLSGAAAVPAAEGGEGGEGGGEGGGTNTPTSYALQSRDPKAYEYDAKAQLTNYVAQVHASYAAAATEAKKLQAAIDAMLAAPSDATLAAARKAWIDARPSYLVTETFRFYDGPIEDVEGRINAWPMNEAYVDYVEGKPNAGLVNDKSKPLTIANIDALDQKSDEADVTTGWHAVEFLLWGQDLSATGPGNRPFTDYVAGKGNNDRRRAYLKLVTAQLVGDLEGLAKAWDVKDGKSYAAKFSSLAPREQLGRVLNGMAVLAGFELMSERLAVALDSGDQEDEHSCFSDNTHADFVYDLEGIYAVWTGDGPAGQGAGLDELVAKRNPALKQKLDALLADARKKVAALGNPWDQVLAKPKGSPERKAAEAVVKSLTALGNGLKEVGGNLGVLVTIPTAS